MFEKSELYYSYVLFLNQYICYGFALKFKLFIMVRELPTSVMLLVTCYSSIARSIIKEARAAVIKKALSRTLSDFKCAKVYGTSQRKERGMSKRIHYFRVNYWHPQEIEIALCKVF